MRACANLDCDVSFSPSSHNQKYHNADCCRTVTNRRIMDKYYEDKEIRKGKFRLCRSGGCENILSRYNLTSTCHPCDAKKEAFGIDLLEHLIR